MAYDWTKFDEAALAALFFLGHRPGREDTPIIYPADPDQRSHLVYYGTTRSGKTYAMEYDLQQLAEERRAGFCYIDPHGSSYWRMASFLRQKRIKDRVLFWDINDPEYVVTYDPFGIPGQSPSYVAGNLASALLATLGGQAGSAEQPHLKTITEDGLLALLNLKLPFALSDKVFDPTEVVLKRAIAARTGGSPILKAIAALNDYRHRKEDLQAPFRRFYNLFQDDRLRLTFTTAGLDFGKLMDEGWIVLVNTEPKDQHDEAATLFTRLLVKHIFMTAKQRPKSSQNRPFFLIMDEASRYLTTDTARILAETAGYGLYLVLGMQSIEQAKRESEETYTAIRSCVNAEIVMRLSDPEEALYFARRFYGPYMELKTVKDEQIHTAAVPRTVAHVTKSRTKGDVSGGGSSRTRTRPFLGVIGTDTESDSNTYSQTTVDAEQEGFHVEYDYEKVRQTQYYSPDELERIASRRFMLRQEHQSLRLGVVRVNATEPTDIEIPLLDAPMYSRDEMAEWLRDFKATQAGTLPLIEARSRFDALVTEKVKLLMEQPIETILPNEQQRTAKARRLRPNPDLNPANPRKKTTEGPSGQEG